MDTFDRYEFNNRIEEKLHNIMNMSVVWSFYTIQRYNSDSYELHLVIGDINFVIGDERYDQKTLIGDSRSNEYTDYDVDRAVVCIKSEIVNLFIKMVFLE